MHHDPLELALSLGAAYDVAVELRNLLKADQSGWREIWLERLNDPGFRERNPGEVSDYLDPGDLKRTLEFTERRSNPFDPDVLRIERFCQALRAGGKVTLSRIDDGEEVAQWQSPGSREGGAWSN